MVLGITLKRYIEKLQQVITSGDERKAENLQREILAVLGNDIDGLKYGLTNYEFSSSYLNKENGKTMSSAENTDFLQDARILNGHLQMELEKIKEMENMVEENKTKKVFISHSSKDKDYIQALVELFEDMGLKEEEIVCSSVPPYCIPLDNGVYEWLVSQFQSHELHVIYALSENYYSSVASMNEMGAAWVMKHKWTGILMPGFSFDKIEGCIDRTQIGIKLDDSDKMTLKYRLSELKNSLIKEFKLDNISEPRWERKRDKFLNEISEIAKRIYDDDKKQEQHLQYKFVVGKQDVGNIPVEPAFLLVYAAEENGEILRIETIGEPVQICTNRKQFLASNSNRESARWQEALDMLCNWGWVKSVGNKKQVFELTGTGYKKAEFLKDAMEIDTEKEPLEELIKFVE